jgi:hypothetical protein
MRKPVGPVFALTAYTTIPDRGRDVKPRTPAGLDVCDDILVVAGVGGISVGGPETVSLGAVSCRATRMTADRCAGIAECLSGRGTDSDGGSLSTATQPTRHAS